MFGRVVAALASPIGPRVAAERVEAQRRLTRVVGRGVGSPRRVHALFQGVGGLPTNLVRLFVPQSALSSSSTALRTRVRRPYRAKGEACERIARISPALRLGRPLSRCAAPRCTGRASLYLGARLGHALPRIRKNPGFTGAFLCARYWDRTSDLFRVREARYRCANRA